MTTGTPHGLLKIEPSHHQMTHKKKGCVGHDGLYTLCPFVDAIVANWQQAYIPARELAIDESMIKFNGRLGFIQYNPKKPIKWGLKAKARVCQHRSVTSWDNSIKTWHFHITAVANALEWIMKKSSDQRDPNRATLTW